MDVNAVGQTLETHLTIFCQLEFQESGSECWKVCQGQEEVMSCIFLFQHQKITTCFEIICQGHTYEDTTLYFQAVEQTLKAFQTIFCQLEFQESGSECWKVCQGQEEVLSYLL